MSWADTLIATALATLTGRTATAGRIFTSTSSSWNRDDVWLARAKQPRDRAPRSLVRDPAAPTRHLTVLKD
jgi:hypothetical protein